MRRFIRDLAGPKIKMDGKDVRPEDRRGQFAEKGGGQHSGLLLQRYLCEPATGDGGNPEEKQAILRAAINAVKDRGVASLYHAAFNRWKHSLMGAKTIELQVMGRLIVGLGSENVLETGLRLHQTFGMPIIPGSALKGVAAHYCHQVWGESDRGDAAPLESKRFRCGWSEAEHEYHRLLFGSTDDSGCIVFHDAWHVPGSSPSPLVRDVMTPHHPKWSDGRIDPQPPTDFDSPTPVPFLSVTGKFYVALTWHGPEGESAGEWLELAQSLLCEALAEWGVGGKTTSGYGRLTAPPPPKAVPPAAKRKSGDKAQVKLLAARPKGGFDVQDIQAGRKPGTLTLGTPPSGTDTNFGQIVDVLVHVDDPKTPQYKWPPQPKK